MLLKLYIEKLLTFKPLQKVTKTIDVEISFEKK
jgi:hypothetical protein